MQIVLGIIVIRKCMNVGKFPQRGASWQNSIWRHEQYDASFFLYNYSHCNSKYNDRCKICFVAYHIYIY